MGLNLVSLIQRFPYHEVLTRDALLKRQEIEKCITLYYDVKKETSVMRTLSVVSNVSTMKSFHCIMIYTTSLT